MFWSLSLRYGVLVGMAVSSMLVSCYIEDFPERKLPFKSWLPYSYPSFELFLLGQLYSTFAHAVVAGIGSSTDTLIVGLMMRLCTQMKILKHRLQMIAQTVDEAKRENYREKDKGESQVVENLELAKCIRHHCILFALTKSLNETFVYVIFLQFAISSAVLCFSVLELTKVKLGSPEFMFTLIYLACMLVQIFLFCWHGNNIILESVDVANAAYKMDWTSFSDSTKKSLLLIITRSLRPLKLTSGHLVILSLDSYNSLIKMSYSAYNVLSQQGVE